MKTWGIRRVAWDPAALPVGTILLLGNGSGAHAGVTPAAEDVIVGTWRSPRPAGADTELFLTLRLLPDGRAELYTAQAAEGPAFLEVGDWRLQGAAITVLVFEEGRPPDPNEMLLERRDSVLIPVRWNPEFYGKSALGHFLRQPDQ